jgi:hypothetical protein
MRSRLMGRSALLCLALAALALAQQANFVLSYILPSDLNVVPLQPGGSIFFPATPIGAISQAALNITNTGNASGQVNDVSIIGSAFGLQGLPLFPVVVNRGQTLQLLVRYKPSGAGSDTGQIQITYDQGATATINLQGTLSAAKFTYALIQGGQTTPVSPGGSISVPDTNVGQTSSVAIRVTNAGNLSGTVNSIVLSGQDFHLAGIPALPQTLLPNASFTFNLTFTPTGPANRQGSLSVDNDFFNLIGTGLGSKLVFSYASGGTTVTLGENDSVVFSPVMISQSGQLDFFVTNTGTVAATIFNIGIGESKSPFSVTGLPPLPIHLNPAAQSHFRIDFTPATTGFSNGTLRIDTLTVGLIGSGTPPPTLPAYTIQGPSGTVDGMTQPSVSLKLSKPYPVAVAGTLNLSVSSDLPSDPAVQFSTGGRSAQFVIPANSTEALFTGQGSQIQLQTGTVASTITLTPSFATQAGGVDLTPDTPVSLQFTVPPAAPTLVSVQIGSQTTNSFLLTVTGFSTTRSLTALNVQFAPAAGFSVPTTPFNVDLSQVAAAWFQSSASLTFGGQFTATIPFTLQGTVSSGQSLLAGISSVSVTVSNERGTSNSVQTSVP